MAIDKITNEQFDAVAVISQPDTLDGTADQNKAVFDAAARLVKDKGNETIDEVNRLTTEDGKAVKSPDGTIKNVRLNGDNVIETSADGASWQATGSSGHVILDAGGNAMPQRSRMQFAEGTIEDVNGVTVIHGVTGPKGDTGDKGDKGDTGERGPVGPVGPTGLTGARGPQGVPGEQGLRGPAGAQGATGPAGPTGPRGATGATGATGPEGPRGIQGATGPQGPVGVAGKDGKSLYIEDVYSTLAALRNAIPGGNDKMYQVEENRECYIWSENALDWVSVGKVEGPVGPQGVQGVQGVQGERGPEGPTGATGPTGPEGPTGPTGPAGPEGPQGPRGIQGVPGEDGLSAYATAVAGGYEGDEPSFYTALGLMPAHMDRTDNPHSVTPSQIGAVALAAGSGEFYLGVEGGKLYIMAKET